MNWERVTRGRWRAPGFEIRAVVVKGRASYRSVAMGARRTWLGIAEAWHDTAEQARDWCKRFQRDRAQDGRL